MAGICEEMMIVRPDLSAKEGRSIMKCGITAFVTAAATGLAAMLSPVTAVGGSDTPFVALGADLTETQKTKVMKLLNVTSDELTQDTVVTVTNADEHKYLGTIIDSAQIGTKAISSCKVTAMSKGYGIQVKTHNISYVTADMYENALATAGMSDAEVVVAAPVSVSGTAALVGAMEAYSKMKGTAVDTESVENAVRELVTEASVAEHTGDSDRTAQLIAAVKQIIAEKNITDESDIRDAIADVATQLGVSLTESDIDAIVALMKKLASMDLDVDQLTEQAQSIYRKAKDSGLDLSKYGISQEEVNTFFSELPALLREFVSWLRGVFHISG